MSPTITGVKISASGPIPEIEEPLRQLNADIAEAIENGEPLSWEAVQDRLQEITSIVPSERTQKKPLDINFEM